MTRTGEPSSPLGLGSIGSGVAEGGRGRLAGGGRRALLTRIRNTWGVDAMALDPQDPNKVYAAVGMYTNDW